MSVGVRINQWFTWHRGVFIFLAIFGILMGMFYIFITFAPVCNNEILPAYHHFIAGASSKVLSFLGEGAMASGAGIFSPGFSVTIIRGCDAVEATGLLMCAVLAFPVSLVRKAVGIVAGAFVLAVLNLVRVVALFLIGVHLPRIFNVMHLEVLQGLFILFAVALWVVWLGWAVKSGPRKAGVPAE